MIIVMIIVARHCFQHCQIIIHRIVAVIIIIISITFDQVMMTCENNAVVER